MTLFRPSKRQPRATSYSAQRIIAIHYVAEFTTKNNLWLYTSLNYKHTKGKALSYTLYQGTLYTQEGYGTISAVVN